MTTTGRPGSSWAGAAKMILALMGVAMLAGCYDTIIVQSEPSGLDVLLDGLPAKTPATARMKRGQNHYVIFADGTQVVIMQSHRHGTLWPLGMVYRDGSVYDLRSNVLLTACPARLEEPSDGR